MDMSILMEKSQYCFCTQQYYWWIINLKKKCDLILRRKKDGKIKKIYYYNKYLFFKLSLFTYIFIQSYDSILLHWEKTCVCCCSEVKFLTFKIK